MQAAGLPTAESQAKIKKWSEIQADFLGQTGLKRQYGREEIPRIAKSLTKEEKKSIYDYVSAESYIVNEKLRNGKVLTNEETALTMHLDSALAKLPRYKGNLSRSLYFISNDAAEQFISAYEVGTTVTYREYISTTRGETYNPEGQVQIYIEKAKKGRDLAGFNDAEQEVLYERGATFFVDDVVRQKDKCFILLREYDE